MPPRDKQSGEWWEWQGGRGKSVWGEGRGVEPWGRVEVAVRRIVCIDCDVVFGRDGSHLGRFSFR